MKYLIVAIILFFAGWFANSHFTEPEIIVEQHEKIIYEIIERDVYKMPDAEIRAELNRYYTEKPRLEIIQLSNNLIRADAGLGDRDWSRKADLKVASQGNWNFYILLSAGIVGAGIAMFYF